MGLTHCAGAQNGTEDADKAGARRQTEIQHEPCELDSDDAVLFDADRNGKPDIITVMAGGRAVCRAVDMNLDAVIDVYVYYDENGRVRRRESGFDRDGLPDEIAFFRNGELVRKERETNNDRKIDTWDFYQAGRLARAERDATADGFIDQWWTFNRPERPDCAVVTVDTDDDGKPDESSKLDLCESKASPFGAAAPPAPTTPATETSPEAAGQGGGGPEAAPTAEPTAESADADSPAHEGGEGGGP